MRKLLYCWCDGAELIAVLRVVGHTLFCLANNLIMQCDIIIIILPLQRNTNGTFFYFFFMIHSLSNNDSRLPSMNMQTL